MPVSFITLSDQIELNEKRLAFEYERYENYNSRLALITIIYSVIAIYLVQLLQFSFSERNHIKYVFIPALAILLLLLIYSLYHAILLVKPRDVSYLKLPIEFYEKTRKEYEAIGITEEDELNEYLRASYNYQLEEAVTKNANLCFLKSEHYFKSFQFGLMAVIPYLICLSIFMVSPKEDTQVISVKNYKEIENYQDSLLLNWHGKINCCKFDSALSNQADKSASYNGKKIKNISVH